MKTNQFITTIFLISVFALPKTFAADAPHTILEGHTDAVYSVAFNSDGDMLASKSKEGTIKIWNPITRQPLSTINTNTGGDIVFSPDGRLLASGDEKGKVVNLWNPNTGKVIKTIKEHKGEVSSLAFSPNGTELAIGTHNDKIYLWNYDTDELLRILGTQKPSSLSFNADGSSLANRVIGDRQVKVWNTNTGEFLYTFEPAVELVFDIAFSPDGHILASAGWGGIDLWDTNTGELLRSFPRQSGRFIICVAFSPDGRVLAGGRDDKKIDLWDVDNALFLKTLTGHTGDSRDGDTAYVYDVMFSPDGHILASAGGDKTVRLWEITPQEEVDPPQPPDFLTNENLKTWTEDFNAGHLNAWKKRELQRERVTWQAQNDRLHVRTKPFCNGRLNVGNRLEEQTNYTLRFTALPINVEHIRVKLSVVSTHNANVGIFLGKDPQDEIIHPFEFAYQFADHTLGSPEKRPRTSAPRIALNNLDEIDVVFDRGHFYLFSNDEYIVDFKVDTLETIDLLGIAVFPKVCRQVADVVVDDFIISGPSIPDAVSLNVRAKGKAAVLWGKLKQN